MKSSTKHGRLLRRRPKFEEPLLMPSNVLKFDESSGQVYTETTVSIQSTADRNWSHKLQTKQLKPHSGKARCKGNRSLSDLATDGIIDNLSELTLEWVEELPHHLKLRIWELANEKYTVPLQVWKIFSIGFHNEGGIPLNLLRYREDIKTPRFPLQFYTTALTSPNVDFLTALSITAIFTVPDLVKLSSITNLAVLEIVHTAGPDVDSGVSDRLLRTWHEASITKAAFRVLRILRLWNHDKVTSKSLTYISNFPALALYDVKGCSLDIEARALAKSAGWTTSFDVGSVAIFEAACVDRAMRLGVSDCIASDAIRNAPSQQLNDDLMVTRLPRREIRQFLTNALGRRVDMPQSSHDQKADDGVVKTDHSQAESRGASSRSHKRKSKAMKPSWEFDLYTIFSRIGELRNDQDLSKGAGLNVGDQAIVNDELVNSIPLACIRLGPSPAYLLPTISSKRESFFETPNHRTVLLAPSIHNVSFIRIKVPGATQPSPSLPAASEKSDASLELDSTTSFSVKHRSTTFMKNKKRKLDDVLGSFI